MVYERFVTQFDGCSLCGGAITGGFNCSCAGEAMWLYRASQGKISTTSCHIRSLTGDCVGGTNLNQMQAVSINSYGIKTGTLYQPTSTQTVLNLVATGRYGSHLNIGYSAFVGTPYDVFHGQFHGNHDIYLSNHGATAGTTRVGDPGYSGFRDIPNSLLIKAAGLLNLGSETLNQAAGTGKCYAYLTPADPIAAPAPTPAPAPVTNHVKFPAGYGIWIYNVSSGVVQSRYAITFPHGSGTSCAPPVRVGWPGHWPVARPLVRITAGFLTGKYVSSQYLG